MRRRRSWFWLAGLLFGPIARFADLAYVFEQAGASVDRLGEILTAVLPELRNAGPEGPALRDDTLTPQASSPEPAPVSKPSASAKATADK